MRPFCLVSWSGRVREQSISHLWGLGSPICKVGSLDRIPGGALTNSDIPRPCGSQPHLSLGGQNSSVTPRLSPEACLSREAASEEPCHCPLWRAHQPLLLPLVASGQHTAGTARSPKPTAKPVEGWGNSSKWGFSEPCCSCRGQEGKGRGTWGPFSDLKSVLIIRSVKLCQASADTELVTTEQWLFGKIEDLVTVSLSTQHFHQLIIL